MLNDNTAQDILKIIKLIQKLATAQKSKKMKKQILKVSFTIACMVFVGSILAQEKAIIKIDTDRVIGEINPQIYSSFLEPLRDVVKMANFTLLTTLFGFDKEKGFYQSAISQAFSLYSNNSFGESLDVYTSCPTYDATNYKNVPYLDVTSAFHKETGEVVVNVVSRSEAEDIATTILLQKGKIGKGTVAVELNGSSISAINTFDNLEIKPVEKEVKADGNKVSYSFPAHSLTMIKFKVD
jgi:alpha-N-arabinofuranosidase